VVSELPPYQRLVDGLVLPATVADEPALDFCNTRAGLGALALRDGLYAACTDSSSAAWDAVAADARNASAAAVLVQDAPPGRRWVIPESAGLDLPALEVARAAGALLASTDLETVGQCPGEGCGWLFLDTRGRRRWCTMAVCGNRAKARRHAARARQEAPA
jgi:predicted RNA-binding Zn ribbon-like protein